MVSAAQQERRRVEKDRVVIRKYPNRRLYDTCNSRYINLDEIAALVRNGKDVQVIDSATGEDITRVTLTQIIVENAKGQPAGLPLELLRQLIVATDHVGQEFIMWYLKSAVETYQNVQSSLHDRLGQMQSAAMSPLNAVRSFLQSGAGDRKGEDNRELNEMRRQIAELESKLQRTGTAKRRRRK